MTLNEKMAALRRQKGYTQDEVAERLGVTPQAVSKWENGVSCPDIMLLSAIADMFEVTVDELLCRTNTPIVSVTPESQKRNIDDMVLRILITSADGDNVKLNLPIALIKVLLGSEVSGKISDKVSMKFGNADLSGVDWEKIMMLVESGVVGRLVEIESADGDVIIIEVI